jgi:hypothetical protein
MKSCAGANAEPPGSPATAEGTQRLFSLLSKGFIPCDCDAVDLVGGQRAAIICQFNREPNGPYSATYTRGDAKALQSGFFTAIGQDDHLVACPGTNQSRCTGTGTLRVRWPVSPRWCGPAARICCLERREASMTLLRCISGGRSTADRGAGRALLGRSVAAPGGTVVMVAVGGCGVDGFVGV